MMHRYGRKSGQNLFLPGAGNNTGVQFQIWFLYLCVFSLASQNSSLLSQREIEEQFSLFAGPFFSSRK